MKLQELLNGAETISILLGETTITGVQFDSRNIGPGDCFFAIKGDVTDGNKFIKSAIDKGAVAVVTDAADQKPRFNVGWAQVPAGQGRRALGCASANLFDSPARRLGLVGVTGTNGKTTTTYLIEAILAAAGKKSALLGTIEYRIAGNVVPSPHTTPESLDLNRFLDQACRQGASAAVMEVSSHALQQERVYRVQFDVAVFTNLTRDHLDYHRDMEAYFEAKKILFAGCGTPPPRVAVINQDDEYGKRLIEFAKSNGTETVTYGFTSGGFHAGADLALTAQRTDFTMSTPAGAVGIHSELVGKVNVYNILAAAAAAHAQGVSLEKIAAGVAALSHVPGRFQRVNAGQPFTVVVDYAHTDDALRNLTAVARDFVSRSGGKNKGRVITVFGCGGDRDRAKRPLMGEAAGQGSDFVVLTSDNPRSEDPLRIIHDALAGLRKVPKGAEFTIEPDRKRAIGIGCSLAQPGDIVLIAGKGHEKVQVTLHGSQPFDDVEVARAALSQTKSRASTGRASGTRTAR